MTLPSLRPERLVADGEMNTYIRVIFVSMSKTSGRGRTHVARVLALEHARQDGAVGEPRRHVLHRVDANVHLVAEERHVELLREEALAADLAQRLQAWRCDELFVEAQERCRRTLSRIMSPCVFMMHCERDATVTHNAITR